jgi:flagellar biosynthetic protein FliQ
VAALTDGVALAIVQQAVWVALKVAGPVLGVALAVGLLVGVVQASTSINDQTLGFLPKLVVIALALVFFGPWMLATLVDFARELLVGLPGWI